MPLATSTSLLMVVNSPVESVSLLSADNAVTGSLPALMARLTRVTSASGVAKTTLMGCVCWMETMPLWLDALTMLPWSTSRNPTRPVSGALMVVYPS